jgi:hypothetical protein
MNPGNLDPNFVYALYVFGAIVALIVLGFMLNFIDDIMKAIVKRKQAEQAHRHAMEKIREQRLAAITFGEAIDLLLTNDEGAREFKKRLDAALLKQQEEAAQAGSTGVRVVGPAGEPQTASVATNPKTETVPRRSHVPRSSRR